MEDRLNILLQSGVIDQNVYNTSVEVYNKYFDKDEFSEDKVNVFMTHFAMALKRISEGNVVDKLDEEVFNQVKSSKVYDNALNYWNRIKEDIECNVPTNEEEFFLLHLGSIFSGK